MLASLAGPSRSAFAELTFEGVKQSVVGGGSAAVRLFRIPQDKTKRIGLDAHGSAQQANDCDSGCTERKEDGI